MSEFIRKRKQRDLYIKAAIAGVKKDAEKLQYSPGFLEKITKEYEAVFNKKG